MSNPKWEKGPVKLVDGSEAWIFFVQPESRHQRYIGKFKDNDGEWRAMHWCDAGRVPYTTTGYAKNLAPPPKKKVRVRKWINVNADGGSSTYNAEKDAARYHEPNLFARLFIDIEVEEGQGL